MRLDVRHSIYDVGIAKPVTTVGWKFDAFGDGERLATIQPERLCPPFLFKVGPAVLNLPIEVVAKERPSSRRTV